MKVIHQKHRSSQFRRLQTVAAALTLSAAMSGSAWAESSCGKRGYWEGEGLQREVTFSNRLLPVISSYFIYPSKDWRVGGFYRSDSQSPVGAAVCKGFENSLRGGIVRTEYIQSVLAQRQIDASVIREECNMKERELRKLPPDMEAQVEEKRREILAIRADKEAMARMSPKEKEENYFAITVFQNRKLAEHAQAMQPQLSALHQDCQSRADPLVKDVRYSVLIQINPAGTAKVNSDQFHLLADLGDKSIRTGPNDKVRRVLVYVTSTMGNGRFDMTRAPADMEFLKTQVDLPRLQALIDSGGQLPSDAELATIKANQQAAAKEFETWRKEQDRLVSQAERDRRFPPRPQARPAASPSPAPAPAARAPAPSAPAPDSGAAPAAAPAPTAANSPAPAPAPAAPALPNIQIPGNVGNVLRGVFGR